MECRFHLQFRFDYNFTFRSVIRSSTHRVLVMSVFVCQSKFEIYETWKSNNNYNIATVVIVQSFLRHNNYLFLNNVSPRHHKWSRDSSSHASVLFQVMFSCCDVKLINLYELTGATEYFDEIQNNRYSNIIMFKILFCILRPLSLALGARLPNRNSHAQIIMRWPVWMSTVSIYYNKIISSVEFMQSLFNYIRFIKAFACQWDLCARYWYLSIFILDLGNNTRGQCKLHSEVINSERDGF
jgi:hypothetical protein